MLAYLDMEEIAFVPKGRGRETTQKQKCICKVCGFHMKSLQEVYKPNKGRLWRGSYPNDLICMLCYQAWVRDKT